MDLALAEIAAKLARGGRGKEIKRALAAVEAASEVVPISAEAAGAAGLLLARLRRVERGASHADAVMLASARAYSARLVSRDACFRGQSDVFGS